MGEAEYVRLGARPVGLELGMRPELGHFLCREVGLARDSVVSVVRERQALGEAPVLEYAEGDGWAIALGKDQHGRAFFEGDIAPWQMACPFRQLFSWMMDRDGAALVHAAAVDFDGGAVLFPGPSGSGKSTLAALLTAAEPGRFYGDDWVPVEHRSSGWHCGQLYRSHKLSPWAAARFFGTSGRFRSGEKEVFLRGVAYWQSAPIRALVVPSVSEEETALAFHPITPAEAALAIGPPTVLESPGVTPRLLGTLVKLCHDVRAFRLALGKGMLNSVSAILSDLTHASL